MKKHAFCRRDRALTLRRQRVDSSGSKAAVVVVVVAVAALVAERLVSAAVFRRMAQRQGAAGAHGFSDERRAFRQRQVARIQHRYDQRTAPPGANKPAALIS